MDFAAANAEPLQEGAAMIEQTQPQPAVEADSHDGDHDGTLDLRTLTRHLTPPADVEAFIGRLGVALGVIS